MNIDVIIAWLKSKSITSHSIAAAAVAFAVAYSTNEPLRDLVLSILKNHPVIVGDLGLAVGAILKYTHSSSPAGAVAAAEVIEASPKAPSPAAVEAAKTSTK